MLSPLYAIADRATLDAWGIGVSAFAQELAAGGVRLLQYRDKRYGPEEVLRAAREIAAVFAGTGATLLLNDHANLAAELGWGLHIGQGDLAVDEARRLVPAPAMLGLSTHNPAQIVVADITVADYLAIGPVFSTTSKSDADPVVGLEGVQLARSLTTKPLVAIGGITLANARSVLHAGADSVAVISGLLVPGRRVRDTVAEFFTRLR